MNFCDVFSKNEKTNSRKMYNYFSLKTPPQPLYTCSYKINEFSSMNGYVQGVILIKSMGSDGSR